MVLILTVRLAFAIGHAVTVRNEMTNDQPATHGDAPLFCDRCLKGLTPGNGEFYLIQIEAVADPTPPSLIEHARSADITSELNELVSQMGDLSPQEAMDQVHRKLTIQLCVSCYRDWIENPTGS